MIFFGLEPCRSAALSAEPGFCRKLGFFQKPVFYRKSVCADRYWMCFAPRVCCFWPFLVHLLCSRLDGGSVIPFPGVVIFIVKKSVCLVNRLDGKPAGFSTVFPFLGENSLFREMQVSIFPYGIHIISINIGYSKLNITNLNLKGKESNK